MASAAAALAKRCIQHARDRARANLEGMMTATVVITRRSVGELNEATGSVESVTDSTVYSGAARMVSASGPVTYTVGEEVQFFSSSYAYLPIEPSGVPVQVRVNDMLQVTAHDDPVVVGRRFRVVDVETTGLLATTRRIQLVGIQSYAGWEDTTVRVQSTVTPTTIPQEWRV